MFLCDFIDEVSSFCNIHGETVDKSCFPGLSSYLWCCVRKSEDWIVPEYVHHTIDTIDTVGGPASDRGGETR